MKSRALNLSVIVPIFNEANTLKKIVDLVLAYLPPRSEVILVDDGSTDGTSSLLNRFARLRRVKVFSFPRNRGKGYAVRYGLRKARGRILLIQDADLEYHPKYYSRLLRPIQRGVSEVVYGSRLQKLRLSLKTLRTIPLPLHFLANRFLSFLTNLLYGSNLTDMETCYKVFTRKVYRDLDLQKDGFDFEAEITAKILRTGYRITEVPITTTPRSYEEGKKITWKDGIWAVVTLVQLRLDSYLLAAVGVVVVAAVFRFYDFTNRYGFWSDQSRDALVGRIAVAKLSLPLIGSFSSAGPFTFGPYWYWYSALMSLLFPTHMGYWIGMVIASLVMVVVLMWIGREVGNRFMSILTGLFAAISFSQLQSSLGSTQHSMVAIFVSFFLATAVLYLRKRKPVFLFLAALLLSFAINFHYQAMYLIPMLGILFLAGTPSLRGFLYMSLGLLLPFGPLILFDLQHHWWNFRQALDYYRFGQYRIYVPNRWLTYAGQFWPDFWSKTVGGHVLVSYFLMLGIGMTFVYNFVKRRLSRPLLVYGLGFLGAIIWFRYFRGERFEGYIVYSQPLIFLFSAWFVSQIAKHSRAAAFILSALLIFGSIKTVWNDRHFRNAHAPLTQVQNIILADLPSPSYTMYDHEFRTSGCSIGLSLLLDDLKKSSSSGLPLGVCQEEFCLPYYPTVVSSQVGGSVCKVVDLRNVEEEKLSEEHWVMVSPEEVHRMTVEWWKDEDLTL